MFCQVLFSEHDVNDRVWFCQAVFLIEMSSWYKSAHHDIQIFLLIIHASVGDQLDGLITKLIKIMVSNIGYVGNIVLDFDIPIPY